MNDSMLPREKLMEYGPAALSNAELLAILLRTGTVGRGVLDVARDMLRSYGDSIIAMSEASVAELSSKVAGLGPVKSIEILAALELGRRRQIERIERIKISNSSDAYQAVAPFIEFLDHEEVWTLVLDNLNQVSSRFLVSSGGWTQSVVDVRQLLRELLIRKGVGFILAHNHPAGSARPSAQDIQLTHSVKEAARTVGLHLRDHIIVARSNGYYSFLDNDQL